ncbi:MAG: nucleoside triphosphate pyrophosphohydrolase [Woeseiaceae bacterium]
MSNIDKLLEVMAALRNPQGGCPWDLQQDFASVAPYTLEEAYEVADAIARDDFDGLRDELGDLLLQVVFHARMAEELQLFNFNDVAGGIVDKLLRRHPHVFGSADERRRGMQDGSWESIKAAERRSASQQAPSAMDGVANALPALKRAQKLGERASRVGFDWPTADGAWQKIDEELQELRGAQSSGHENAIAEELGDLLFAVVNLARHLDVDAEQALSNANRKFEGRFRSIERQVGEAGQDIRQLPLATLEDYWLRAKGERHS